MRFNVLLIEGRRRSRRYLDLTIMCVTISSAGCCVRLALSISFVCKQECLSFVLHNDNKSLCTGPDGIAWSSIRNVYSPFSEMRKCKSFPCREKLQLTTSPSWSGGGHNNQVRAESSFNLTANNSVGRC